MSRVSVALGHNNNARPQARIDILDTYHAERIASLEDFREFFNAHMSGTVEGVEHSANCVVRLISPESGQVIVFWVYSASQVIELPGGGGGKRSFKIPDNANATWDDAITNGRQAKGLAQMVAAALGAEVVGLRAEHQKLAADLRNDVANDKILIEAIPGQQIRIIGDSLDQLIKPEVYPDSPLARYASQCWIKEPGRAEMHGFLPMHTNVLISHPMARGVNQLATVVAAKFIPDPDCTACDVRDLATPHYAPKPK